LGSLALVLVAIGWVTTERFAAFGGRPSADERARMRASPRHTGDRFTNEESTEVMKVGAWQALEHWFSGADMRSPPCPLPLFDGAALLKSPPSSGLRVTWLGHSTTLVEIDGVRILTDPQWGERASPSTWVGPKRF